MAAELKIFSDDACTTELTVDVDHYTMRIGEETGLNGTDGEVVTTSVWIKNTGTILISNVTLTETLDTNTRGSFSLDDVSYNATTLNLGNLAVSDIVRVYIKVTVGASTAPATNVPLNFAISGTHLDA